MNEVPVVSTPRLDLVSMSPAFLEASLAGDYGAAERLIGMKIPVTWYAEQWLMELRLGELRADPSLQPWLLRAMGLRSTGQMVGYAGFHTQPDPEYLRGLVPGGVELGYTVFPEFQRQGYARETSAALMRWAAREHNVTRFVLSIRPDNTPSLRLAEFFGFKRIGTVVDPEDGPEDIYELHLPHESMTP
jgi:[ribosomal protein S5]-alanine N-acetyltransferase